MNPHILALLTSEVSKKLILSANTRIAIQQALFVKKAVHYFGFTNKTLETKVAWFNTMPPSSRNNVPLLKMALEGTRYFHPTRAMGALSLSEFLVRVKALDYCSNSSITLRDDNRQMSLLSYIGMTRETQANMIHDSNDFASKLSRDCLQVTTPDCVSGVIEELVDNKFFKTYKYSDSGLIYRFIDIHQDYVSVVVRALTHISHQRDVKKLERSRNTPNCKNLKDKVSDALDNVATSGLSPLNWYGNLRPMELLVANKFRPSGSCLGIELEFLSENNSDMMKWSSGDYPKKRFLHFKGDSSINTIASDDALPRFQEMTYFMNGKSPEDWKNLKEVLDTMNGAGARVNSSCGNHVHLDMRGRSSQQVSRVANKLRQALKDWAHRSLHHKRSYNQYCGVFREHLNNKYTAVNLLPFRRFGTIEVRVGMATLNFYKLKLWVGFLEYCVSPGASIATFDDFMQSDCSPEIKVYIFKRMLKFHQSYLKEGLPDINNLDKYKEAIQAVEGSLE